MARAKSFITRHWAAWFITAICIYFCVVPVSPTLAAVTKTTTLDIIDNWQRVPQGELVVGNAEDISGSYRTIIYIEVAITDANAHEGGEVIVEISYADDNWVEYITFKTTAETAATTTINDGTVSATDTSLTLTDSSTGDFNVNGRKWFILDGTVANSESVKTQDDNGSHLVSLCQDLLRSHANGLSCYDRVDEYVVAIPDAAAFVRVIINNTDADCDQHFTSRASKVPAI